MFDKVKVVVEEKHELASGSLGKQVNVLVNTSWFILDKSWSVKATPLRKGISRSKSKAYWNIKALVNQGWWSFEGKPLDRKKS